MHRKIRRKDRQLPAEAAWDILQKCPWGVLSTADTDGQPYGIPVNYVVLDGAIYIHCAGEGHKLDNIRANSKVSFTAVSMAETLPSEFATAYESAIAFGTAREIDGEEKFRALMAFIDKFSPAHAKAGAAYVQRAGATTNVIRIDIEHITAKSRKMPE